MIFEPVFIELNMSVRQNDWKKTTLKWSIAFNGIW